MNHNGSGTVAEYARDYSGKTGVANMTNVIARYNLPITVEEGLTWEVARENLLQERLQQMERDMVRDLQKEKTLGGD